MWIEDQMDDRHQILIVGAAQVVHASIRECLAVPRAASRVDREHRIAARRIQLKFRIETEAERAVRTAVNVEDHRRLSSRVERWVQPPLNLGAVEALEGDRFGTHEL